MAASPAFFFSRACKTGTSMPSSATISMMETVLVWPARIRRAFICARCAQSKLWVYQISVRHEPCCKLMPCPMAAGTPISTSMASRFHASMSFERSAAGVCPLRAFALPPKWLSSASTSARKNAATSTGPCTPSTQSESARMRACESQ